MKISRVKIENFRNFKKLEVEIGQSAVILGENQIGKTNFLCALRLLLDPSLPDSARQLKIDDFWDGIERPISSQNRILISVEISDFEDDENMLAILAEHIVQPEPMVAKLTYEFCVLSDRENGATDNDFEFLLYGGNRQENTFGYNLRKWIPLEVLPGLRDAESDLAKWSKSPLKPLLERTKAKIKREELEEITQSISNETNKIAENEFISNLAEKVNDKIKQMIGENQAIQTAFGFSSTDPDKLLKTIRLFFDEKRREISEASLGMANVLYLALRNLELDAQVKDGNRQHTFYCIEEPEAHLHPHLQRLVFRNYLQTKKHLVSQKNPDNNITYFLTTHSPHIASVSPVDSLILLRKEKESNSTIAVSGAKIGLDNQERADIERYLDVSRAEGLFSRGIILVEGEAEKYLVPVFASCAGYDLDAYGITVCSVGGTNFTPYVKFFGPNGLNIPLAVITDLDVYQDKDGKKKNLGINRANSLCYFMSKSKQIEKSEEPNFYKKYGIFLNDSTLEIELNRSGCIYMMNTVMKELCTVKKAKDYFQELENKTNNNNNTVINIDDPEKFIEYIEYIGKGRFAQRLAEKILSGIKYDYCPPYIMNAIKYVIEKIS
jgi:putative ATP-dependent endonuclease of OLD family